jgi:hypothetical protein
MAAYPFCAGISEDFERWLDKDSHKLPPMTSKVKLPMVMPHDARFKNDSLQVSCAIHTRAAALRRGQENSRLADFLNPKFVRAASHNAEPRAAY